MKDELSLAKKKLAKQTNELGRLNREVEQLKADKRNLAFDLAKARKENEQLREQLAEARA